jgi:hypothetical protein
MVGKDVCYYKIILICGTCGKFVIIDFKPFRNKKIYTVGCEGCRSATIFCSGRHLIGERDVNIVGNTVISFVRKA